MKAKENVLEKSNILEEPQLTVKFYAKEKKKKEKKVDKSTLNMLSLFSGCGGMDLGFEGDFSVLKSSVNDILNPHFINKELEYNFVKLSKTRFKTVFANDILKDARNAWVNYFSKRGHNAEDYQTDSIVDLVKLHQSGTKVFPKNIDIVTGGFPCQD
ncbi:MAG: DNA cytosine methyltransferase, partial [Winogradskyella sp.]